MTQFTLDGKPDVWVRRCRKWWHPQPCCRTCGETLTAFDYTADEAKELAEADPHQCKSPAGRRERT